MLHPSITTYDRLNGLVCSLNGFHKCQTTDTHSHILINFWLFASKPRLCGITFLSLSLSLRSMYTIFISFRMWNINIQFSIVWIENGRKRTQQSEMRKRIKQIHTQWNRQTCIYARTHPAHAHRHKWNRKRYKQLVRSARKCREQKSEIDGKRRKERKMVYFFLFLIRIQFQFYIPLIWINKQI